MANQSLISVPPNLSDPVVVHRFLSRLVEQLDIILGYRGDSAFKYVNQEELSEQSTELTTLLQDYFEQVLSKLSSDGELDDEELDDRLTNIELLNTEQDDRLDAIELLNTEQDDRLDDLENAGYITDAPSDGNIYGRKDGTWVIIV